jgi:hypothetical protein
MDMISATDVVGRIELYFNGHALEYLSEAQWQRAEWAMKKADAKPAPPAQRNRWGSRREGPVLLS